ncbi:hypothetical protein Tco_1543078, partial [Tanacetum coccineum]
GLAAALAILITGMSQSRQHGSYKSPAAVLVDVGRDRISIITVNTVKYHSDVMERSQG